MTAIRAEQREIADKFCKWLESEHLIGFDRPAPWDKVKELFIEFAAQNGQLSFDCENLKHRYPLRLVCSELRSGATEHDREIWNEYWERRANSTNERIEYCRNLLCKVGSRQVKIKLNALAKSDVEAYVLRQLLELEDVSLTSGKYYGDYWRRSVNRGCQSVQQLLSVSSKRPDLIYCGRVGFRNFRVAVHPASLVASGISLSELSGQSSQQASGVQFEWNIVNFKLSVPVQRFELPLAFYDRPQLYRLEELISRKLAEQ